MIINQSEFNLRQSGPKVAKGQRFKEVDKLMKFPHNAETPAAGGKLGQHLGEFILGA